MLTPMFINKMKDDFTDMCSMFWDTINEYQAPSENRQDFLQFIISFCEDMWNIGILAKSKQEIAQLLDINFPAIHPMRLLAHKMVTYKRDVYPEDRAIVMDATGSFASDGTPAIDFSFDYSIMENEARARMDTMPKMDDIIDYEALERATDGVPEDKFMDAINVEFNRQIEIYNNTPQAELGGKTPNELYYGPRE